MTGTIKHINTDRGFGFVEPIGPGRDVFFHFTALSADLPFNEQLQARRVEYDTEEDRDGRPRAINIRPAN